ncbi:peroxisomal, partial [Trichonephila inaurata madagascariensis]
LGNAYMSSLKDYEEYATTYMDRHARDYYGSGAEDEVTLRDNEKAFQKLPNLQAKGEVEGAGSNLRSKVGFSLLDPTLTWKDIQWIQTFTALPIVVKGVLTAEDAVLAVEHGASGILVSNHGGRQLDGVPATLDALPEIVRAVKGRAEVYLDGGVRRVGCLQGLGSGGEGSFFGRPAIWGLVHSGQDGVENVLKIVKSQLDTTMALTGVSRLEDIQRSHVVKGDRYEPPPLDAIVSTQHSCVCVFRNSRRWYDESAQRENCGRFIKRDWPMVSHIKSADGSDGLTVVQWNQDEDINWHRCLCGGDPKHWRSWIWPIRVRTSRLSSRMCDPEGLRRSLPRLRMSTFATYPLSTTSTAATSTTTGI